MQATVQGGRSPKPMNGPASASQLKPSSNSVQNSGSSFPSQVKGKKRDRVDQGSEPLKRIRTSRIDDGDSGHGRIESNLKLEIAKITEKGALVDSEGVEKLVRLMLPERNKIDLVTRSMLAGVVAATDKFDCLSRFVQLRGLPVFDEWLQEVHKGKIGDNASPKDGDKSIEEFLLVLLRALDKLPVNLYALQMCNIGKSVNHLRTHKNVEIQRKARSLVDTWKKRVEAEMDAKSGSSQGISWPARPRLPEVSHGAVKTSVTKPASPSARSGKSATSLASGSKNLKNGQPKSTGIGGVSDVPLTTPKDEKSSSSSQSHNNSQSYSSDHAKTGGVSGKENKNSSGTSRQRKSVNGFQGSVPAAVQRETVSTRSSLLQRNNAAAPEKLSHSSLTEKATDLPAAEGNSHKLIVKIPNRGRSPAQSAGLLEDAAAMNSRASSPVLSEKNDQFDQNVREKSDTNQANVSSDVNTNSWQSNDFKNVLIGSEEGGGSPSAVANEECCRTVDNTGKIAEVPKATSPPPANDVKTGKLREGSYSSINALIDSCVKYSEVNGPMAVGDNVGMNLLASVAAGEISKSDTVSPTGSPQAKENDISIDHTKNENEKQHAIGTMWSRDAENKAISKPMDDLSGNLDSCGKDLKQTVNQCLESHGKSEDVVATKVDLPSVSSTENTLDGDGSKEPKDIKVELLPDHVSDIKPKVDSSLLTDAKAVVLGMKVEGEAPEKPLLHPLSDIDSGNKKEQKPTAMTSEFVEERDEAAFSPTGSVKDLVSGNVDELKTEKTDEMYASSHCDPTERQKTEGQSVATGNQVVSGLGSSVTTNRIEHLGENLDSNEVKEQECVGPSSSSKVPSLFPVKGTEQRGIEETEESSTLPGETSSVSGAGGSDMDAKVEFDLNEGFSGDDGRNGDMNNLIAPGTSPSTPVQFISSLTLPASVTVTAAAKGPFVPPEDLLRNKGAHGWRGSAATSAFRPAEPRKALELSNNNNSAPSGSTTVKRSRPPLDIDLNVPDERVLDDLVSRSSGQVTSSVVSDPTGSAPVRLGLDLDLNRVDEPAGISSNSHRLEYSFQPIKPSGSRVTGSRITDEAGSQRDFDLNNGPAVDDVNSEPSIIFGPHKHARPALPSQPPLSGIQVNGTIDMGNFSSWFPGAANPYSAVTIPPSYLPDRGDHLRFPIGGHQRMLGPTTTQSLFNTDFHRGQVLSSSPAVPFASTTPFQYPVFPFGTSFPLTSSSFSAGPATYVDSFSGGRLVFPPINSQLLGSAVAVQSNYTRPYAVSLTDGNSTSASSESSRRWFRQDLDLNTGPETEGRTEASSLAPRPLSASSSQTLTEEQARMSQMSGGVLKRKEPEGGWDGYKQSSWQ